MLIGVVIQNSLHISSLFLGDILEHMVPLPEHKLLVLKNIPLMSEKSIRYSSYQWHGLMKHLRQMLIADAPMEEGKEVFCSLSIIKNMY